MTPVSHLPWPQVPARLRGWVADVLGDAVVDAQEQSGGMSPGCATRLTTQRGARAFIKAVGPELHPGTPELFRRELAVLESLGPHPRWAALLAGLDEGAEGWVVLVIEDVEGREPDPRDDAECARVVEAVDAFALELAGRRIPRGLPDLTLHDAAARLRTWATAYAEAAAPTGVPVPPELVAAAGALQARLCRLADRPSTQLVHGDIRADNLLVRPTGEVVVVDWGQAGVGPGWFDPLLARLDRVDDAWFDTAVRSPALEPLADDDVTAVVGAMGLFLARRSLTHADSGPPGLQEFRLRESTRLLAGAARRLG